MPKSYLRPYNVTVVATVKAHFSIDATSAMKARKEVVQSLLDGKEKTFVVDEVLKASAVDCTYNLGDTYA